MNRAAGAGVLAGCIAALLSQPTTAGQNLNAERLETGTAQNSAGNTVSYRIRLLPVTSFPDLPEEVATELGHRQCMIPQSFEAKQPENVIHGAFRASGSSDWAVLCSAAGTTSLYVFFAGQFQSPISLRTQPDSAWLGAEPGSSIFGSAWGIAVRTAAELRDSPQLRRAAPFDHDAIDDARLERSVTIHYYQAGKWTHLNPGDSSD
jgi:hypothetical protein